MSVYLGHCVACHDYSIFYALKVGNLLSEQYTSGKNGRETVSDRK
jgi:hypothetical protein